MQIISIFSCFSLTHSSILWGVSCLAPYSVNYESLREMFFFSDLPAQRHELTKKHKALLMENQNKPHNLPLIEAQVDREREVSM